MKNNLFLIIYIMDLSHIVFLLLLLVLVLFTFCLEQKTIMYFIIILLILLVVQKCVKENKAERFADQVGEDKGKGETIDTSEAADKLMAAAGKDREINGLQKQVGSLEKELRELRDIMRMKSLNTAIEKNAKSQNFDLSKSQEQQDATLDALESELDVLLKLYRKETENEDKTKYHSLPIYSSCKAKEEGMLYLRDYENTESTVQMLENEELMKNLGIDSKSSAALMSQIKKGEASDNINFNINLV